MEQTNEFRETVKRLISYYLKRAIDPNDSYGAAKERRERRRKDALRDMLWTPKEEGGMAEEAPTGDPAGDSTPPPPESL